jgi:hypothetical protein
MALRSPGANEVERRPVEANYEETSHAMRQPERPDIRCELAA